MNTYLDIETGPLSWAEMLDFMPEFSAPSNWKDPDKIKANIEEQRAKWMSDGALSALTGRVLCVGLFTTGFTVFEGEEAPMICSILKCVTDSIRAGQNVVGFCIKTFDLPFLIRRAFKLGIVVPHGLFKGRYWNDSIIDVAELWSCGNREPKDRISLDTLSKFLGIGAKLGDGADFAKLWASDKAKALQYLENDVRLTKNAYERMTRQD